METINILLIVNRLNDLRFVNMLWKRKLHENAVNLRIVVECVDEVQQLFLCDCRGSTLGDRVELQFLASLPL